MNNKVLAVKIVFCAAIFLVLFLIPHDANAYTINATSEEPVFGPNDNIAVYLEIQGYDVGPITWIAHRPDGSTLSGSLDNFKGNKVTHQIFRNAFDNYFGNWSIDYTYKGETKTAYFKVEPLKFSASLDKKIYYEPDIMKINITASYFNPVAQNAQFFYLNFYDENGNLIKNFQQINVKALSGNKIYNFPISNIIDRDNPPGDYKFRIQYYNLFVEVPFFVDDYKNLMTIILQTDKPTYNLGDTVNLHLLFTRVTASSGEITITDPSGNKTTTTFPVNSVSTDVNLKNITYKSGIYSFTVQYSKSTQKGTFVVTTKPTQNPDISLNLFLDKLKYRPGDIINAKIHTTDLISDSISFWFEDPDGVQSTKINTPMKLGDLIIPHKINRNDLQGLWKMHIDYGGAFRTAIFYLQGSPVENYDLVSPIKFSKPKFLMTIGSSEDVNFKNPKGVAIDTTNDIYVVDSGNAQVKKFNSTGKLLLSWGSYGSEYGKFKNPSGVLVDQKYVYIADTGNARIQKFDKFGNFVLAWGKYGDGHGFFHTPVALVKSQNNNIFVSDSGVNKIQEFDTNGMFKDEIRPVLTDGGNFTASNSIVFDSQNNLFIVDSNSEKIFEYSNLGKFINYFGSAGTEEGRFNNPSSIAIDSNGYLYVTDRNNHRVQKFDSDGTFLLSWGSFGTDPGQFEEPIGLTIDSQNSVYVVDGINNSVQKFASFGTADEKTIPRWVKNSAQWWSVDLFSDNDFVEGIRYMVNQGIIQAPSSNQNNVKIPTWVKTNAGWWSEGLISDAEFTAAIQYLISVEIMKI